MGDEVSAGSTDFVQEETLEQLTDVDFVQQLSDPRLTICSEKVMREFQWMAARSVLTVTASADYGRVAVNLRMLLARVEMERVFPRLSTIEAIRLRLEYRAAQLEMQRVSVIPEHLGRRLTALSDALCTLEAERTARSLISQGYRRSEFVVVAEEVTNLSVEGRVDFFSTPSKRVLRRRLRRLQAT